MSQITEEERRSTVEADILNIVCSYGGNVITAGPILEEMVRKLADEAEALARRGLLTPHTATPGSTCSCRPGAAVGGCRQGYS